MRTVEISFEELIAPVSAAAFFADYWEKQHLYLPMREQRWFSDLFSMEDVDRWLMSTRSGGPDSILVAPPDGADHEKSGGGMQHHRPRELPIDEAYSAYSKGHSLVLNQLEDSWPPVSSLVKMLGGVFCADVGVNAYLTPKGSRTFPLHVDEHDVFVLQVEGEKVWRLQALERLPIMRLGYRQDLPVTPEKIDPSAPLAAELVLRPGDVLFVPRGMPHCAVTESSSSLHLTVSITPLYWVDFLKMAAEQTSLSVPSLRASLPPRFVNDAGAPDLMETRFAEVLRAFVEAVSFNPVFEVARRNRVRALGLPPDGHFKHLTKLESLTVDSEVELRPGLLCSVEYCVDQRSQILFGKRVVKGPGRLIGAMRFIKGHDRFKVKDLPELDDQSKVVLVRRLVREGLLRFAEKSECAVELVRKTA